MEPTEIDIHIRQIHIDNSLYQQERQLRNQVLLHPIGLPSFAWEHRDPQSLHLVALKGSEVIGCLILFPDQKEQKSLQLMQMAVKTCEQRKGVGRLLVNHAKTLCAAQGYQSLFCHSRIDATPFYHKLGFKIYGEPFFEVDVEHRLMRVEMPGPLERS